MDLKNKDIKQNGLLKTTSTQRQYSESVSPTPLFMMILRKLILEQFQKSMYSQEDSPAKTLVMPESELALRGVVLHSGNITCEQLARYDQSTHSLRTFQHSLEGDSTLFSATLHQSGMMRNGIVYQLPRLVRLTVVTGFSSWPTPRATDSTGGYVETEKTENGYRSIRKKSNQFFGAKLQDAVRYEEKIKMWPTPTARDYKGSTKANIEAGNPKRHLDGEVSGQLNPTWVEWLQGFPLDWTNLEED